MCICKYMYKYVYPYIYIYIYISFNTVNPVKGIILIWTNQIFKSRILNLNNPGNELNINKIHGANIFFLKCDRNDIYIYIYI